MEGTLQWKRGHLSLPLVPELWTGCRFDRGCPGGPEHINIGFNNVIREWPAPRTGASYTGEINETPYRGFI